MVDEALTRAVAITSSSLATRGKNVRASNNMASFTRTTSGFFSASLVTQCQLNYQMMKSRSSLDVNAAANTRFIDKTQLSQMLSL